MNKGAEFSESNDDVLVLCEESQAVCNAFREVGRNAFSCDLLPCSGGHPEWHIQQDAIKTVRSRQWGLVISFPPCTDLAVSGAKHFYYKREDGRQENSIRFFFEVWKNSNCCENPVGIMSGGKYIKKWFPVLYQEMMDYGFPFKQTQIIQPWQFGHGETKATCLFLNGLPKLKYTNVVDGREAKIWKLPPSKNRAMLRSKTYHGIATAMAQQWGEIKMLSRTNKVFIGLYD